MLNASKRRPSANSSMRSLSKLLKTAALGTDNAEMNLAISRKLECSTPEGFGAVNN